MAAVAAVGGPVTLAFLADPVTVLVSAWVIASAGRAVVALRAQRRR